MPPSSRHLLHVLPSFEVGGIQVRLVAAINRLDRRFRHTIVAMDGRFAARDLVHHDRGLRFECGPTRSRLDPVSFRAIRKAIREIQPDLLLTYNWGAIDWAMANSFESSVRHVHFEDGFGLDEADRQFVRRRLYRRIALRRTIAIVVPSQKLERIARDTWGVPAHRIRFLTNGVDVERFSHISPDKPAMIDKHPDEILVGTVAPLRPEKNIARLFRVFSDRANRSRARLVIAGDGPERDRLQSLATTLGLADRVVFTGHVSAPETVLRSLDVFALTSETEQMPFTVLEAMASGLPILGSDVGDIAATVAPSNRRFIIPKTDETRMAAALGELLADATMRRRLGDENRARVLSNYRLDRTVAELEAIFSI